jgi:hypothetical protein
MDTSTRPHERVYSAWMKNYDSALRAVSRMKHE